MMSFCISRRIVSVREAIHPGRIKKKGGVCKIVFGVRDVYKRQVFFLVGDVGGRIALRGIELPGTRRGGGENGQRECRKLSCLLYTST